MLDMGFEKQIREIVEHPDMPAAGQRQTMLFSATMPSSVQRLATEFLHNHIVLTIGRTGSSTDLIEQHVKLLQQKEKRPMLLDILKSRPEQTLVFVATRVEARTLSEWLYRKGGLSVDEIHGDRSNSEREKALEKFRKGIVPVLVATDVASRGLHIPCVAHVINYDLPSHIDDYVHRIGRTGRAGRKGLATAFFTEKDACLARHLAKVMGDAKQEVPSWLTNLAVGISITTDDGKPRRGGRNPFGERDFRRAQRVAKWVQNINWDDSDDDY
eukprot:gnl/TRDRNA2_/TRDRNA2_79781_c2_seq1.p1 gnl/TRDRNA2_/TRDRNA2_79781_c2~~gnl/TRDRNA2_/TRDRNA2_79781_c2_seq1.p1  ORF type:complete len:316 (+),score=46.28 gnl/TRDRNA2_/TRDRNA2_79781_c2_seq1:138-950(+)